MLIWPLKHRNNVSLPQWRFGVKVATVVKALLTFWLCYFILICIDLICNVTVDSPLVRLMSLCLIWIIGLIIKKYIGCKHFSCSVFSLHPMFHKAVWPTVYNTAFWCNVYFLTLSVKSISVGTHTHFVLSTFPNFCSVTVILISLLTFLATFVEQYPTLMVLKWDR